MKKCTPEQAAQDDVELAASSLNMRLLRNNSGALTDNEGRLVRFGLGNVSKRVNQRIKSGDLVGWTTITITPEMVGKQVAVFTNVEVKPVGFKIKAQYKEGTREHAQEAFNQLVRNHGGFAGFATSKEDLNTFYNHFLAWLTS